mmetsp:Transcript_24550/g.31223  ORF Transcript_24550/g.31223 Transcript_24550/m.31223 type:complete len:169 (-) Transcript_24550:45-551(-)
MFAEKVGEMKKRGHVRHNWKKRLFILHNDGKLEYQTPKTNKRKGILELENYTAKIASPLDISQSPSSYIIHLVSQSVDVPDLFCCTKTEEEMKDWLEALSFACDESKKRARIELAAERKSTRAPSTPLSRCESHNSNLKEGSRLSMKSLPSMPIFKQRSRTASFFCGK